MESKDKLIKRSLEITFVGATMAVGLMWKDVFSDILGSTLKGTLIGVAILTLILAFVLVNIPETLVPSK